MPEQKIPARYYGVPEAERPTRETARVREVGETIADAERNFIPLPDAYLPVARRAAESVAEIVRNHVSGFVAPPIDRVFLVSDEMMREDNDAAGSFHGPTNIIKIKLSELLSESNATVAWKDLQMEARESYGRILERAVGALRASDLVMQSVIAFQVLFTVSELSEMFRDESKVDVRKITEEIAIRLRRWNGDPDLKQSLFTTFQETLKRNPAFDDYGTIATSPTEEEGIFQQFLFAGRLAHTISSHRLARAVIEIVGEKGFDAIRETLTHELVHAFAKNYVAEFPGGVDMRSGYHVPSKKFGEDSRFQSLNEACTEIIAQRALGRLAADEAFVEPGSYRNDRLLLARVVKVVAEKNGGTTDAAWSRFERGYFTGELMSLREIERAFGREAWEYYKVLMPDDLYKPTRETRMKVKRLFGLTLPK